MAAAGAAWGICFVASEDIIRQKPEEILLLEASDVVFVH